MKKLTLFLLAIIFSLLSSYSQDELSNYEKYRLEKEKEIEKIPDSIQLDTIYIKDTIYIQSDQIINNYYEDSDWDNPIRFRLYFGYHPWYSYDPWYYSPWYDPWYHNSWYYSWNYHKYPRYYQQIYIPKRHTHYRAYDYVTHNIRKPSYGNSNTVRSSATRSNPRDLTTTRQTSIKNATRTYTPSYSNPRSSNKPEFNRTSTVRNSSQSSTYRNSSTRSSSSVRSSPVTRSSSGSVSRSSSGTKK